MDAAAEWAEAQGRVIALLEPLTAPEAERRVPACPDWSVRDLLAHMVGLDADVLAGDEPDDHNAAWTQAQIDARAGHDLRALIAEWRDLAEPLQDYMRAQSPRPLGDVIIHEQDLRGALGVPGARDTAGLSAIRDRMAGQFAAKVADAGLPPVLLACDGWQFATEEGEPGLRVEAPEFDLARALTSRRTAAQLRSWVTGGDIERYLPCFAVLGPLPETELPETETELPETELPG